MNNKTPPTPNLIHPIKGYKNEKYVKPTIMNPNIVVGDFTCISDSESESHVTRLYDWNVDKLIIGNDVRIWQNVLTLNSSLFTLHSSLNRIAPSHTVLRELLKLVYI